MRWANEDQWTSTIKEQAAINGVPYTLVQAVIGQESQFKPAAYRGELKLADGSAGLMQILYATARDMGYTGPFGDPAKLSGLFDPTTNIIYGTRYLGKQYARAQQSSQGAVSAYNGGWRPTLGFGLPATKPVTICLAWDQKIKGKCLKSRDVKVGEYGNQPHVDAVMANLEYFEQKRRAGEWPTAVVTPVTETGETNPKTLLVLGGALLGLWLLRALTKGA